MASDIVQENPKPSARIPITELSSTLKETFVIYNDEQQFLYEEKVFSLISQNSGKLRFVDLLEIAGGNSHKQVLYKALANLAHKGNIKRLKGIGKKNIEYFYHDSSKIKIPTVRTYY